MKQQSKFKETEIGSIPEEWEVVKTDELILPEKGAIKIGPFGSQLKKEFLVSAGYKVYGQENVFKNDFLLGNRHLTKERFDLLSSCELKPGDFLMSMMGTIGFVAIVPKNIQKGIMDSHLLRLRIDESKFNKKFLLYAFRSRFIQNQLDCLSVGCIMAGLSSGVIKKLIFPKPKLAEQSAIAKILSDLDEQIELNQQMNKSLEAIGQALFKHWFIDFEFPNEKGKPYKSSGGKMVDSELGEIPEGWRVAVLPEVSLVVDCLHTKKPEMIQEGHLLLQVYNIATDGTLDFTEKYPVSEGDYQEWIRNIEVKEGDCLITNAGRVGAVGQVPMGFKGGIGRNITAIRPVGVTPAYLFRYLFSSYGLGEIGRQTDQGTVLDSLNVKGVKKIRMLIPLRAVMDKFEEIARPLREKVERNKSENDYLAAIRDSLLPRLMSGKIRVRMQ